MRLNVTLIGDAVLRAAIAAMPNRVFEEVATEVWRQTLDLQKHIVADKLTGQVLNVRTGNLRRSIQSAFRVDGMTSTGRVFSAGDVKYAAIHEFGFDGIEHVRTFQRMQTMVFGKEVEPFEVTVSAHDRHMRMPMRSFMRTGLHDQEDRIIRALKAAALRGAQGKAA